MTETTFTELNIKTSEFDKKSFIELHTGDHTGTWKIEKPQGWRDPEAQTFLDVCSKVIPEALREVDPRIRRYDTWVLFEESLIQIHNDPKEKDFSAGGGSYLINNQNIIILSKESLKNDFWLNPETGKHIITLGIILHELFERDYNAKSERLNNPPKLRSLSESNPNSKYSESEQETVPTARAVRILERVLGGRYMTTVHNRVIIAPRLHR